MYCINSQPTQLSNQQPARQLQANPRHPPINKHTTNSANQPSYGGCERSPNMSERCGRSPNISQPPHALPSPPPSLPSLPFMPVRPTYCLCVWLPCRLCYVVLSTYFIMLSCRCMLSLSPCRIIVQSSVALPTFSHAILI